MGDWHLIIIGITTILILVGIILVLIVWKMKKEGGLKEPNYQAFFIVGICFLSSGITFMTTVSPAFIGITVMGLCYIAIGLANKEKWKKKKNWK